MQTRQPAVATLILLLFAFVQSASAQQIAANTSSGSSVVSGSDERSHEETARKEAKEATPAPAPAPVKQKVQEKPKEGKLSRWVDVQTATLTFRYRYIENSKNVVTYKQGQYQGSFKGRFKFDKKGNYSINAGVFTGTNFTGSWNNTGLGTGDPYTNHWLKQLYFSAKPVKGVEFQYGGLYLVRGENTEITSYDNDGYIMGERVSAKRPKELFFDEISVTYGYLGDLTKPNINKRFNRLQKSNYHQFLVAKNVGKRLVFSTDYTFLSGVETMREAVKVNAKELRLLDSVRFENYQRTDVKPAYGYGIYGEKVLHKRVTLGGGFVDIDSANALLNGDRYTIGKRFYFSGSVVICPEITVSSFYTHATDNSFAVSNKNRFDFVVSYNLFASLKHTGLF